MRIFDATGGNPVTLESLPAVKSADAVRFPLEQVGPGIVADAAPSSEPGSPARVILCDQLFHESIGADCGGPAEDVLARQVSAGAVTPPLIEPLRGRARPLDLDLRATPGELDPPAGGGAPEVPRLRSSRMGEAGKAPGGGATVAQPAAERRVRATAFVADGRGWQGAGEHRSERTRGCVSEERSGNAASVVQARQPVRATK